MTDTNERPDFEPRMKGAREKPASLLGQFGETRKSFSGLINAHVNLFKAELSEILGLVKVIGALAAVVFAVALMTGTLLYVGGFLFLGEWLFGSMGWGLAHGFLFGIGLIVALVLAILGAKTSRVAVAFVLGAVVAVAVALLCGSNIAYDAASSLATNVVSPLNSAGVLALLAGAVVGGLLFALMLGRMAGIGGAIVGLVVGALLGGLIGWLIAGAPWTWPPAVGFGITIGLLAWIIVQVALAAPTLDIEKRFSRLYPRQSIEAVNETRAFLEEQWRSRQPKLGKK